MKHRILVATAALMTLLPARPLADVSLSLIEYRVLAAVGQVRLTTGFVHDPETQKTMLSRLACFDHQGVIPSPVTRCGNLSDVRRSAPTQLRRPYTSIRPLGAATEEASQRPTSR